MTGNIRDVRFTDAKAIADIYNYYIAHTTVTYETELVTAEDMAHRIKEISAHHPYFVYEEDSFLHPQQSMSKTM